MRGMKGEMKRERCLDAESFGVGEAFEGESTEI